MLYACASPCFDNESPQNGGKLSRQVSDLSHYDAEVLVSPIMRLQLHDFLFGGSLVLDELFELFHAGEFADVFQAEMNEKVSSCFIKDGAAEDLFTAGGDDQFLRRRGEYRRDRRDVADAILQCGQRHRSPARRFC